MLERDQSLSTMKTQTKAVYLESFLLTGVLYYPEERDEKGELIKARHHVLLRRTTLLNQPKNEITKMVIAKFVFKAFL